jgi:hypothetical protein
MKKWFVITQKKDVGSLLGFTNVVLAEGVPPNLKEFPYGDYPWYALPKRRNAPLAKLPASGLNLVSLNKLYGFDLRGIGGVKRMYAMSSACWQAVEELKHNFHEVIHVPFVFKDGSPLATQPYAVARPDRVAFSSAIDQHASAFDATPAGPKIRSLVVNESLDLDLFTLDSLATTQDTLFCSERAVDGMVRHSIRGIQFVELSQMNWPLPPSPADVSDILSMLEPASSYPILI